MAAATETGGRGISAQKSGVEHPLLRSGLIMSGANKLRSGDDDGVLTALEAASIDLWGTQLVVLSACETGVGDTEPSEGVSGLRRAFVIAGAQTLVMSLWQVDDEATRHLMVGYYKGLMAKRGRSQALRRVQLRLMKQTEYEHPYFWAAFIPSGNWEPMSQ